MIEKSALFTPSSGVKPHSPHTLAPRAVLPTCQSTDCGGASLRSAVGISVVDQA